MRQIPPDEDHAQSGEELSSTGRKTASSGPRARGHEEIERGRDGAGVADPRRLQEAVFGAAEDTRGKPQTIPEESIAANTEEEEKPSLWARISHSTAHGEQRKKPSRSSQRQNKTPMLLGAGALLFGFAIWLLFLVSSPVRKPPAHRASAPPAANAQQTTPPRSSTPTTESQTQQPQAAGESDQTVTPADIRATAGNRSQEAPQPAVHAPAKNGDTDAYALGKIPPPPTPPLTAPTPPAAAAAQKNPLDETSLVFVLHPKQESAVQSQPAGRTVSWTPAFAEKPRVFADLPEGARLVAQLETPASTAVALPVVAEIEYNYEGRDGYLLIPAGSKVFGTLEQADAQGFVGLHFTSLRRPSDPEPLPFEARAIGLDYMPLKGIVTGRHRGRRFLVRAASGIGSVAAATVGMDRGTGLSDGLSNNVLIREQLMNNIGSAGDRELQQLAYNRHTVVTVPGNTRFYLVIDRQPKSQRQQPNESPAAAKPSNGISAAEMRQLIEFQRELNEAVPQPISPDTEGIPKSATVPAAAGTVSPEKPQ